jgi:DNA-binding GntR family transcriptional regulator
MQNERLDGGDFHGGSSFGVASAAQPYTVADGSKIKNFLSCTAALTVVEAAMSGVVRATLADQAYRELRSRILRGQLAGGCRLRPDELAAELAISPTPVKEALVRLEADGLAVSSARKGVMVRRLDEQDLRDIYDARLLIELDALDRIFERKLVGPALIGTLREHLRQHEMYARRDTIDDLVVALGFDRAFHGALVQAAGNALIAEWHQRILGQTHTVFVYNAGNYAASVDDHRAVLDALAAGARKQAREALRAHLLRSRENSLRNVRGTASGP